MATKKTALLIMAAGIGSRFGGGIKQLQPVGIHGELIIDYSVHDALEAGFNKIIFVIRKDIEKDFRERIGDRVEKICGEHGAEVCFAFQDMYDVPGIVPEGRAKPWGTGQAVLAARDLIDMPFAVINADDYYGKCAFVNIHRHLAETEHPENEYCMAGFILRNTLSDNGAVTRGICGMNEAGYLTTVKETGNIVKTDAGAASNGMELDPNSLCSMNMWGIAPSFLKTLEEEFKVFFETEVPLNPLKSEYLLPVMIGRLVERQKVSVRVLPTADKWFGVTYKEDTPTVQAEFRRLIETGVYAEELYSDLK